MKKQLEFMLKGSDVTRYHTLRTLQQETVGHHSHGVAMLVLLIKPDIHCDVVYAALTHDLAEHLTGDIPSPAKRLYGISDTVSGVENELIIESGWPLFLLTPSEQRVLKLADIAQGALFCAREVQLGNALMRTVFDRYLSYAEELTPVGRERELFDLIKEMV